MLDFKGRMPYAPTNRNWLLSNSPALYQSSFALAVRMLIHRQILSLVILYAMPYANAFP
jgi:hypothetical protein